MKASDARGTLTMNRAGLFKVRTFGENHCGIKDPLDIKYTLIVECAVTLDERGFLFDQVNVDSFFQSIKRTKLSCEQFSIECARKLWTMIHRENKRCVIRQMSLTLSPEPFMASMTFSYNTEIDGKPTSHSPRKENA